MSSELRREVPRRRALLASNDLKLRQSMMRARGRQFIQKQSNLIQAAAIKTDDDETMQ